MRWFEVNDYFECKVNVWPDIWRLNQCHPSSLWRLCPQLRKEYNRIENFDIVGLNKTSGLICIWSGFVPRHIWRNSTKSKSIFWFRNFSKILAKNYDCAQTIAVKQKGRKTASLIYMWISVYLDIFRPKDSSEWMFSKDISCSPWLFSNSSYLP